MHIYMTRNDRSVYYPLVDDDCGTLDIERVVVWNHPFRLF